MKKQAGFGLYEQLLALALIVAMLGMLAPFMMKSVDERAAKATADDFALFQTAVSSHFLANRAAYIAAMKDGTGAEDICKVGVDPALGTGGFQTANTTMHTCAIDGAMLKYLQALPEGVRSRNRYGEQWVAIFKLVYTKVAPLEPTGGVEMLIVSASIDGTADVVEPDARRYSEAVTASELIGGGVIPDTDRAVCRVSNTLSIYEACGNGWKINLGDFIDPDQLQQFKNRLTH